MPDSVRPHRQQPTRLPRPWDSPGKSTGVGVPLPSPVLKMSNKYMQNMNEFSNNYKWKYLEKSMILIVLNSKRCILIHSVKKQTSNFVVGEGLWRCELQKGIRKLLNVMEMFVIMIAVVFHWYVYLSNTKLNKYMQYSHTNYISLMVLNFC